MGIQRKRENKENEIGHELYDLPSIFRGLHLI